MSAAHQSPPTVAPAQATGRRTAGSAAGPATLSHFGPLAHHWLAAANTVVGLFLAGGLLAPVLQAAGLHQASAAIYRLYRCTCHQRASRSFFLLGPRAAYTPQQLEALGADPARFRGSRASGWKMAMCQRDLAISAGLLAFGLLYGARLRPAGTRSAGYGLFGLLVAPLALDGLTERAGRRESSWQQRLATGLLFGLASGWLLYPRFQVSSAWRPVDDNGSGF